MIRPTKPQSLDAYLEQYTKTPQYMKSDRKTLAEAVADQVHWVEPDRAPHEARDALFALATAATLMAAEIDALFIKPPKTK